MTTAQSSGVVDMSGVVGSILRTYDDALTGYQRIVTGDPNALNAAAKRHTDQANTLAGVAGGVGQCQRTVATNWQGDAHNAFQNSATRLGTDLNSSTARLRQEAGKLSGAAELLHTAKSTVDSVQTQFRQYAQNLIQEATTAASSAANSFVDAAKKLGDSALTSAKQAANDLGSGLAKLYGIGEPKKADEKETDRGKIKAESKKLKTGALGWLDDKDVLNGRKRQKSGISGFHNDGWTKWTMDGPSPTKAPLKANTPFGSSAEPPEDASAASKALHNTSATLYSTGKQDLVDPFSTAKADGSADFGSLGSVKGNADYTALGVTGQGDASIHNGQVDASGDLKGVLVDGKVTGSYEDGPVEAKAQGEAFAGADLSGHLMAGQNGVAVHANAFAGVQAQGSASAGVAGVNAGVTGGVQFGIGGQFDGQATMDNWHLKTNFKAGFALGPGASLGASVDVDVPKVINSVQQYGAPAYNAVQSAAGSVANTANQAATVIGKAYLENPGMPW